jgi:catechol 2,3-dioxygenase-like lactoylglutathione lyase family enzyme
MAARALLAVHQNVRDHDRSRQFYESLGFQEDIGYRLTEGAEGNSQGWFSALGTDADRVGQTTALAWPYEPFMHLVLHGWKGEPKIGGFPSDWDRLGTVGLSLLVDDVAEELQKLEARGILPLSAPETVERRWGPTTSAFVRDPLGNFLELVAVDYGPAFDPADLDLPGVPRQPAPTWSNERRSVMGARRSWLHFEVNCLGSEFEVGKEFYESFGFADDPGCQQRVGTAGFDLEAKAAEYKAAFGFDMAANSAGLVWMGRLPDDHSFAHLEIWPWNELYEPASIPSFLQKGLVRYTFIVEDLAAERAEFERRGIPVHMETQWGELQWGDSEFFYFNDPDGNLLCYEANHPARTLSGRV